MENKIIIGIDPGAKGALVTMDMDGKEEWKEITGYNGKYFISSKGRVKSLQYKKERILKPSVNSNGYFRICLPKKNWVFIHRLVAENFIPNPNNFPVVNHLDEDRLNNSVTNLSWCTQSENLKYSSVLERIHKKQSISIIGINVLSGSTIEMGSLRDADRHGFNRKTLSIYLGKQDKTYKGYIWKRKL